MKLVILIGVLSVCGFAYSQLNGNILVGNNGEMYNMAGFSSFKKLSTKLEEYLIEKLKDSFSFIFRVTNRNTSEFLSYVTPDRFITLQLLYAFSEENIVYGNLLLRIFDSFKIARPDDLRNWIEIHINFKKDEIYSMVKFIATGKTHGLLNLPESFTEQIIFMDDKYSIFKHACLMGDADVVIWFLKGKFDLSSVPWKVLEEAWANGHLEVVKIFLENDFLNKANATKEEINKTINNQTLLHVAAKFGLIESTIKLISLDANINGKDSSGKTPIFSALEGNQLKTIKILAAFGANVSAVIDESGDCLIHEATLMNNPDAAGVLLDLGAPVDCMNKKGMTPLYMAVANNYVKLIYVLSYHGANLNFTSKTEDTLMHCACSTGTMDTINSLIDLGAAVDKKNRCHETPLYIAAKKENLPVIQTLVSKGADIYSKDRKNRTLLHKAARQGDTAAIRSLIRSGVNVDVKGENGNTALYDAVDDGFTDMVRLLLNYGANPNVRSRDDWTPLHRAARWGFEDIAQILLNNGAKANVKSSSGWTPLSLARYYHHKNIADLVRLRLDSDYPEIDMKFPEEEPQ